MFRYNEHTKNMNKPILYYQVNEKSIPCWNFCSDAAIGAYECGIEVIPFQDVDEIKKSKYDVIVGSVEQVEKYFNCTFTPIERKHYEPFSIEEIESFPVFVKPGEKIKEFTGIIANNKEELLSFTNNTKNAIIVKPIIKDIESEWRVYIGQRGIIGIKHYIGNPYLTPDKNTVEKLYNFIYSDFTELSYTIDVCITSTGVTKLVEINDGWAIGNYGLSPKEYYIFVRDRMLQMQGILK